MPKVNKLHDVSENTMKATSTPILAIVARMAVTELERRAAKIPAHADIAARVAYNARVLISQLEVTIKGRKFA